MLCLKMFWCFDDSKFIFEGISDTSNHIIMLFFQDFRCTRSCSREVLGKVFHIFLETGFYDFTSIVSFLVDVLI